MKWRWQVDEVPGCPEANMVADAALLASAMEPETIPVVRAYTWDRAAVSIGRLQREEPVRALFPNLPLVRRPTGGRAVLHGDDLTLAVALRLSRLPLGSRSVLGSHEFVMNPVKDALIACGLSACYGGCPIGCQKEIIDCFKLSASCDLIDGHTGAKLVGSAQRREGDALLQQISLPGWVIPDRALFLAYLQAEFGQVFENICVI